MNDALVIAMIAGVTEEPPWQEFVTRLRTEMRGNHCNLIFRRPDSDDAAMTSDTGPGMPDPTDMRARYNAGDDPISYFRMLPFQAYTLAEFIQDRDFAAHPFLRNFLHQSDMHHLLICRTRTESGMQAWISVTRSATHAFTMPDRHFLERVAQVFAHALHLFGVQKRAEDQRDAYARVVRSRATGLIQIDQEGLVLHLDQIAQALIEQNDMLELSHDRLRAVNAVEREKLNVALHQILTADQEEEVVMLEGNSGGVAELLLCRASDTFEPAWMKSPRAIVYLSLAGREPPPSPQRLRTLFGLTRKEAALTVLIVRGMMVAEAAEALGISEGTARIYLKSIFSKTGVNRQAELIRRIQTGVAAIA